MMMIMMMNVRCGDVFQSSMVTRCCVVSAVIAPAAFITAFTPVKDARSVTVV